MKTVIYARTAVEDQPALAAQLEQCRAYCEINGLNIITAISEFGCGNDMPRLGLTDLRKIIENGGVEVIVVKSIDRLSRNFDRTEEPVREIIRAGACLQICDWSHTDEI